mgnify:CR=1 FL=1
MYVYDSIDQELVDQRVEQFRDQMRRYLAGELSDAEFLPLRLQNGLYVQKHAPMLRVAIPYGMLASYQLRKLAQIARRWDRGYGHFTTRQNIQFNWPRMQDVPEILAELATVQLHAIQTSGNCVRNTTTDHFAGIAPDEVVNPLVWCEIIRQWSTFHPEFAFLPRKFKIAVSGGEEDRAAVGVHDIGLQAVRNEEGGIGFRVWVGGGLGRTPVIGSLIRPFVPWQHLLTYLESILRVYNLYGRRDNKYKARIKILVRDLTPEVFAAKVEEEWAQVRGGPGTLDEEWVESISARFTQPAYVAQPQDDGLQEHAEANPRFARWLRTNVHPHKVRGYAAVTASLKAIGKPPGDVTAEQMERIASLADAYSFGEVRVTHEQNVVFADVPRRHLHTLWEGLDEAGLATPNVGLITNIICCPGGDFCALANAVSIPVATAIQQRFEDLDYQFDIGELELNISGCINACGHHHVGHIGILGVDKNGEEWYQITLGGRQSKPLPESGLPFDGTDSGAPSAHAGLTVGQPAGAAIGRIIGRSFAREQVPDVIETLIRTYLELRESEEERFIDTVDRVGLEPFKQAVYGSETRAVERTNEVTHV